MLPSARVLVGVAGYFFRRRYATPASPVLSRSRVEGSGTRDGPTATSETPLAECKSTTLPPSSSAPKRLKAISVKYILLPTESTSMPPILPARIKLILPLSKSEE